MKRFLSIHKSVFCLHVKVIIDRKTAADLGSGNCFRQNGGHYFLSSIAYCTVVEMYFRRFLRPILFAQGAIK